MKAQVGEGFSFACHDLTKPLADVSDHGYCTDVLEHIPPEDVDRVLLNVGHAARRVFFAISTQDDVCGALIGEPLHLTVKDPFWWHSRLQKLGFRIDWSDYNDGQVRFWCSLYANGDDIAEISVLNVELETAKRNIELNLGLNLRQIEPHQVQPDQVVYLLAGGPSLADFEGPCHHGAVNCTADVTTEGCEVWVPTQNPQEVLDKVRSLTGLPGRDIRVNITLLGGGFGRRLEMVDVPRYPADADYVAQAVQISQAVSAPVQVFWTRQDDIQHDIYHPFSLTWIRASLDDIGSLSRRRLTPNAPVPTGPWRSVTNPPDAFAHESFMDEFALATQTDPVELRRMVLSDRAMAVVDLAADKAGWGTPLPQGRGRGIAYHATWDVTYVAREVAVGVNWYLNRWLKLQLTESARK